MFKVEITAVCRSRPDRHTCPLPSPLRKHRGCGGTTKVLMGAGTHQQGPSHPDLHLLQDYACNMSPRQEVASRPASIAGILQADMQSSRVYRHGKRARLVMLGVLQSLQVRLIGLVGAGPEVGKVGDQTVAQVSLGIRPKTGNTNEISWVVCDFWNHEVCTDTSCAIHSSLPD